MLGIELTSNVASGRSRPVGPRLADKDDLDEREAMEWAKRAVLDVLEGARTVDATRESTAGVD